MGARRDTVIAFGPVGLAGWALLVLGVLTRRRLVATVGLTAVVADVTVAELGGFKAMNDPGPGSANDAS
jgi:hypothetical protein